MTEAPELSIYDAVLERILSGHLAPGAPVRQDALASELGVSKIPVREALARLESGGLVEMIPNRGYIVAALSEVEAEEVFSLRLKLEPSTMSAGAGKAKQADIDNARAVLKMFEGAVRSKSLNAGRLNREFHMALMRPAGLGVTLQIIERLLTLSERYVRVHLRPTSGRAHALWDHRALFEAWAKRDLRQVRRMTEGHVRRTLEDLRPHL